MTDSCVSSGTSWTSSRSPRPRPRCRRSWVGSSHRTRPRLGSKMMGSSDLRQSLKRRSTVGADAALVNFRAESKTEAAIEPRRRRAWATLARGAVVALLALAPSLALAEPFIWDDDGDGLDDRMESVQLLGYRFSFVDADTTQQQRISVSR